MEQICNLSFRTISPLEKILRVNRYFLCYYNWNIPANKTPMELINKELKGLFKKTQKKTKITPKISEITGLNSEPYVRFRFKKAWG